MVYDESPAVLNSEKYRLCQSRAKKNASKTVGDLKSVARPAAAPTPPPGVALYSTRNFGIIRPLWVRTFHNGLKGPNWL